MSDGALSGGGRGREWYCGGGVLRPGEVNVFYRSMMDRSRALRGAIDRLILSVYLVCPLENAHKRSAQKDTIPSFRCIGLKKNEQS